MTIHLVSTRRARNTQARDLASPPKKAKKEPKHERQHPTSKKHPSEGFGIAPKKGKNKKTRKAAPDEQETPKRGIWHRPKKRQQKNPNTKGSTRRARNTQARDLASPPKKAKKKKSRKAAPDEQETPKRGIWHRPQKRQQKEPKHERQQPTSKKHPSEGFGIAPKKGKAALG